MRLSFTLPISLLCFLMSCNNTPPIERLTVSVYETSAEGRQMEQLSDLLEEAAEAVEITIQPEETFQEITGIGGSFTEASASLLNRLSAENRQQVLEAYFGDEGARYSLTRTHINSCDFSLSNP